MDKEQTNETLVLHRFYTNTYVAPMDYVNFITESGLSPEKAEKHGLTPLSNGIASDPVTKNRIVQPERLEEQGMLLINYIKNPKNRPKQISPEKLERELFDAAFKVKEFNSSDDCYVPIIDTAIERNSAVALKLVEQATYEQLYKNPDNASYCPLEHACDLSEGCPDDKNLKKVVTAIARKGELADIMPFMKNPLVHKVLLERLPLKETLEILNPSTATAPPEKVNKEQSRGK